MSYADPTQPSATGARPPRPTVVTVADWLLWLTAALYIVSSIVPLLFVGTYADIYEQAYAGTEAEGTEGIAVGGLVATSVLFLLLGIGFALLGIFNNQGRNGSRITTWVLGGIALCCSGLGLLLSGLTGSMGGMEVEGGPDPDEIERLLSEELPGWLEPLNLVGSIVSVLALLVALVLLALPPANEFFRKRPEEDVFEPPPPSGPPPAGQ